MGTHIPPVALARRDYWKDEAERAAERGDFNEAAVATRFVREYERLIDDLRDEHTSQLKARRRATTTASSVEGRGAR